MQIIDAHAAREAIELALPTIERAMRNPAAGDSGCLHVVVMDPRRTPRTHEFDASILHEHSVNRANWDADYRQFACAKARISWRHRADSHRVQALQAHLLEPGDTVLWGSVCLDEIVVAVSGMQAWYDEAIAGVIACCLRGIAKARAVEAAAAGPFLPRAEDPGGC